MRRVAIYLFGGYSSWNHLPVQDYDYFVYAFFILSAKHVRLALFVKTTPRSYVVHLISYVGLL